MGKTKDKGWAGEKTLVFDGKRCLLELRGIYLPLIEKDRMWGSHHFEAELSLRRRSVWPVTKKQWCLTGELASPRRINPLERQNTKTHQRSQSDIFIYSMKVSVRHNTGKNVFFFFALKFKDHSKFSFERAQHILLWASVRNLSLKLRTKTQVRRRIDI